MEPPTFAFLHPDDKSLVKNYIESNGAQLDGLLCVTVFDQGKHIQVDFKDQSGQHKTATYMGGEWTLV